MSCYTGGMAKKRNRPKKPLATPPASRLKHSQQNAGTRRLDTLYRQVREILAAARNRAWQAVNTAMVEAYWDVGRVIVEEEQAGRERADYGKRIIEGLSQRLREEFGKGYDRSNLFHMRAFFLAYPKVDALRRQLSWTHYRLLLRVDCPDARAFYEAEAVNARWSTRELERQIRTRQSASCSAPTRAKPWSDTRCRKATHRSSLPGTSCTCRPRRNWPPSFSASDKRSSWLAA